MFQYWKFLWRSYTGLIVMIAVFLVLQLALVWSGGQAKIFNSPDAAVNYHFTVQLATGGSLGWPAYQSEAKDYIAPRSTRVIGDQIVPVTFLGLISIYASLAHLFSLAVIPYLTVLFATFGLIYYYCLIKRVFNDRIAWWSTLLLISHPVWWYYTEHSLLPNVLFMSLALMAIYYWYLISQRTRTMDFFLAGLLTAAALFVRSSEIVWVAALLVFYLLLQRQTVFWSKLAWSVVGALPITIVVLLNSWDVFAGDLTAGYNLAALSSSANSQPWWQWLLPFGFDLKQLMKVAANYLVVLVLPFTILSAAGLLTLRKRFNKAKHNYYVGGWFCLTVYLLVYYGSWQITDSLSGQPFSLANSYSRYLLPIYVFALPFAAWFILSISQDLLPKWRRWLLNFVIICLVLFSVKLTVFEPWDGWLAERQNLAIYEKTQAKVLEVTAGQGVVLTATGDKYLWPAQAVIVPRGDDGNWRAASLLLVEGRAVYYLNPSLGFDEEQQLDEQWQPYNLKLGQKYFD